MASIHLVPGQAPMSSQQCQILNAFAALFALHDRIYVSKVDENGTVTSLTICSATVLLPVLIGVVCQQVETLVLCNCNNLTDVSPVCGMGRLTNLVLRGCPRLEGLPDAISQVATLRTLIVRECTSFVDFSRLENLQRLECLSILSNHLQSIPDQVETLQSLQDLTVVGGQVQALPPSIGRLANLQRLKLLCPFVRQLPVEMEQLYSLTHLDLSANQHLEAIAPSLLKLPNLVHLDLSDCWNLTVPPQDILECTDSLVSFNADDVIRRRYDARRTRLFKYMVRMNRAGRCLIRQDDVPPGLWGVLLARVRNDRDALLYILMNRDDLVQNEHEPENPQEEVLGGNEDI